MVLLQVKTGLDHLLLHDLLVPPFPTVVCDDSVKLLEQYESMHESSTMPAVDKT